MFIILPPIIDVTLKKNAEGGLHGLQKTQVTDLLDALITRLKLYGFVG